MLRRSRSAYYVLDKDAKGTLFVHNCAEFTINFKLLGNKQLHVDVENLVFRGGGMKGIAYCGALDVITSLGMLDNTKRYVIKYL